MLFTHVDLVFEVLGNHALSVAVEFDDKVIFDQAVRQSDSKVKVQRRFLNLRKDHVLKIYINGKTADMTEIDDNGNIVNDTYVKLHSVSLDNVELGEIFFQNASYQHTHNGSTDPVTINPSDFCGFNGCITWNFYCPAIKWLYAYELVDEPDFIQQIKDRWPQAKANAVRKILNFTGINVESLFKVRYFPRYFIDLYKWKKLGGQVDGYEPIVCDYTGTEAGGARGGYYYQDIMVASHIHEHRPKRHVTIGSNLTGFVGHVATFMPIDYCDVRPLTVVSHPNIRFVQADLGSPDFYSPDLESDSVSCLSCIHHVGIGRYGDPINPQGPFNALDNLKKIVKPGGMLYIGTSVGPKSRVIFNQSRGFTVNEILAHLPDFDLIRFDYYNPIGNVIKQNLSKDELEDIPEHSYGIFVLQSKLTK